MASDLLRVHYQADPETDFDYLGYWRIRDYFPVGAVLKVLGYLYGELCQVLEGNFE